LEMTMKTGICASCLHTKPLQKSHLLGKALYRMCSKSGGSPIVMTPEIVMATDKQVWSHLLCRDCEQMLSTKGEDYAMRLVENGEDFPLLNRLKVAMPIRAETDCVVFSGSAIGIDTDKLGYYALSVVWRAAVENWKSLKGQTTTVDLGTFEEPVRKYLMGETGFPAGVAVMAVVCADLGSQQTMYFPKDSRNSNLRPTYGFLVRGLLFQGNH
jgi:hypothetical protein